MGPAFADATEALVSAAVGADGTPAVLKLVVPRSDDAAAHEITALRLCGGEGCVGLLREDAGRGALLLERLGASLHDLGLPMAQRHEILCATAQRVWRAAPGAGLPTGEEKARWLGEWIAQAWVGLDRPCTAAAIDQALACADRRARAHDPTRAVLVHGDVHQWNALAAGEGYKLVDPDGLEAEPEYDLGIIMREDPLELLDEGSVARARRLAVSDRPRRHGDLGVGCGRAGLDRTPGHQGGAATRRRTDVARGGPGGPGCLSRRGTLTNPNGSLTDRSHLASKIVR